MFDVDRYLRTLGHAGPATATLETLTRLHRGHLQAIPYDNGHVTELDLDNIAVIDVEKTFETVVCGRRGGICTQLNGMFRRLLAELGFETELIAASTLFPGNVFGPSIEHMLVRVRLDGEDWLADVGFGGLSFVEPLRVCADVQTQDGVDYRLVREGEYHVLRYRSRDADWRTSYRFVLKPRSVDEWAGAFDAMVGPDAGRDAIDPIIRRRRLVGDEQLTQTGKLCSTVRDGKEQIVHAMVHPAAYRSVVAAITAPENPVE
ncbi:acetyltransferase [Streptomyces ipomoeae]|uniref:N-acetyltransferase n=2 Tax=Streptomyces ipomoeae TaxID=103232 RepID=L1KT58_9ACTN|nr:arylamine N-acetyltransferase [Streptomyces ipomoeae]EKX63655.1 N-acetyltransferase [Streptomyces ipomoeae 91-03]MDX2692604.1 arylamine N-acetyltransferase [Streptomyces ipomoeae]MDX2819534.1 arylamine N-acetyltransferase [Streptomyces ipomoeae]MDX2842470.1 arylamine N-acetyltransferase [Streptomyces ipomoeae]MDX2873337.1 arylamine N-acetyltransferase [Streptomyces ipomoeae]